MNILIVANDFKPLTGGVSEYTHQMAKFLSMRGNKIIVFSPHMEKDKEFDVICPYKIHRYDANTLHLLNKSYRYFKEYRFLNYLVKKNKIEVIIGNSLCVNPYIYWLVAKMLKRPLCVFIPGADIMVNLKGRDGFKKRLVLKNANKIFSISSYTRDCAANLGICVEEIIIAYPGVEIENFKVGNDKISSPITEKLNLKNKKVIFTFGRLIERKGQDIVIKAMPKILKEVSDATYLISGDGPYEKKLRGLAEKYGVKQQVIFAGRVDENQKQCYYDACDIFVMANRKLGNGEVEGFGIVFLEANACGKPVVGGRSGGAVEAIVHNQTGLLIDSTDVNEVAQAIIYLLKNPRIVKNMGQKGRERVEKNFTWGKLIPKIEMELRNLIR